ncbi:TRAP-type C4-dicarboxylate transport system, substrate-binding protein [Collimonas sp. OK607]|uniref:TRAP transporter substrate-binding protein n=1 Tax=Collimonas sp. OK607 TaxID=1798194 RepID=UPI0008E8E9FD|nr:TRAP transporter substrate-binding protein [Collimonas sp. OK607]SFB29608.1 TRAP-type C4-dicarboxylate transport system, substrate-binding protein [Collimonas sp. OK607]
MLPAVASKPCIARALLLPLLMLALSSPLPLLAQTQTLRLTNEYPATSITAAADLQFTANVKLLAGDALAISTEQEALNPFKGSAQVSAVSEGKVEMATLFAGIVGASDPFFLLSSLPFTVNNFDDAKALAGCSQPAVEQHLSKLNAHLLYVTPWPPSGIWSAAPLTDLAALKALRIRTYDENSRAVFEQVGAHSVNLPFSAVPPKLAAGELNAVLSSGDGGAGNRLWEQLGNFSAVSYSIPLSYTVINQEVWQRLKPEQQAILTEAAKRTAAGSWSNVKDRIASNYARMREHKMTLNLAPAQEIQDSLRSAARSQVSAWQQKANATDIVELCLTGASQASQASQASK